MFHWKEISPKTAAGSQWVLMHLLITILASHKLFIKISSTKQHAATLLSSNLSKMLFGRQNNMMCSEKEREGTQL